MFSVPKSIQNKMFRESQLPQSKPKRLETKLMQEKVEEGNAFYTTCGLQIQDLDSFGVIPHLMEGFNLFISLLFSI